nr:uncharacterized protein LOC109183092 [Ipomoea batatas]
MLQVQPKIDMLTQQLNVFLKNMPTAHVYPQGVSVDSPQSAYAPGDQPRTRSSCQSVDMYPVTTIKSRKKCSLALCGLDGKPYVVARGTVYPTTNEITIVHNVPLLPNHVKVMVDEVAGGAEAVFFHLLDETFSDVVEEEEEQSVEADLLLVVILTGSASPELILCGKLSKARAPRMRNAAMSYASAASSAVSYVPSHTRAPFFAGSLISAANLPQGRLLTPL